MWYMAYSPNESEDMGTFALSLLSSASKLAVYAKRDKRVFNPDLSNVNKGSSKKTGYVFVISATTGALLTNAVELKFNNHYLYLQPNTGLLYTDESEIFLAYMVGYDRNGFYLDGYDASKLIVAKFDTTSDSVEKVVV